MTAETVNNGSQTAFYADPVLPIGWAPSDNKFTSDEVLDAYFMGRNDGENVAYQKIYQQYKTKIKTATAVVEEMTELAKEKGYEFTTAFLRYLGKNAFEAIYFVNEDLYLSEDMKNAMRLARDFKKKYHSEDFQISFMFSAVSEQLNIDALIADGFALRKI